MTLLELLHLIKARWYLVVIIPVLFALATAAYSWCFLTDDYTSEVSLYVLSKTDSDNSENVSSSDMGASQQLANDIAVLAESHRVLEETAQALGLESLDDYEVEVTSATTNRVIKLSVTGKRPESAAAIADELASQTADTAVDIMDLKAINIVEDASVPELPSGPNRLMYTAVASLAGLFAAIALIVVLDMLNTTIKSTEDAEEVAGLPVLGRMPTVKGKGR